MKIPVECLVAAPPDIAFAAAIDVSNWPRFISGIQSVAVLTPGPVATGTRFLETRVMFGRQATEEMTLPKSRRLTGLCSPPSIMAPPIVRNTCSPPRERKHE
jgi:hypothetical protein